jgi:cystathionine beta-lyase
MTTASTPTPFPARLPGGDRRSPLAATTRLVRFDAAPSDPLRPSATPIYQTATFEQDSPTEFDRYDYSRSGNPTRDVLQWQIAELENATHALCYASGMAAISAVTGLLAPGDELLTGDDLYGGAIRLFERLLPTRGVRTRYAPTAGPQAFANALTPQTRLVHIETPTNPLLRTTDLRATADALRDRAARLGIQPPTLCVDNTLLTPYAQKPLLLGADVVVHSATKALCGHADVTAGAIATSDDALAQRLAFDQNAHGTALGPMDCFLLLRGLKTLAVRLDRQQQSAELIAWRLSESGLVKAVHYPGLRNALSDRAHARQSRGHGCVIAIELDSPELARRLPKLLRLFSLTVSFGSVASTICYPAGMSHKSIPGEAKARLGPPPTLLRLSIGLEDPDDLTADLEAALTALPG